MRKFLRKLHLWLAIPVGIVITVICLSGASLVFEQEILESCRAELYFVKTIGEKTLSPSELIPRIERQLPDTLRVNSLQYPGDADRTLCAGIAGQRHLLFFVDPYTGEVKGQNNPGEGFFAAMRKLHRRLMGTFNPGGQPASPGRQIVGVCTLTLVLILLSGLVIWIPRTLKTLRHRLSIKLNKGWRRFWWDMHVSLGAYLLAGLLVLALTGLTWSYGWYRTAFYQLLGAQTEQASRTASPKERVVADYLVWDKAFEQVSGKFPNARKITIRNGSISVLDGRTGNMRASDKFGFDLRTGDLTSENLYTNQSRQNKVSGWVYTLHVGGWGGLFSKIITFLVALLGGTLPITGYYLWIRRLQKRA